MNITTLDLDLGGGRRLRAHDTGPEAGDLALLWHHGTPNIGLPPEPLFPTAERLGIRFVGYDRPGYGGSTPRPGRDIGSGADDAAAVMDALGIETFAVMGHSGGGPHALACAARLKTRVLGVVSAAGLAPLDAAGLDWFAGMAPSGVVALRAAVAGREAKLAYEQSAPDGIPGFIDADVAILAGRWSWLGSVVGPALDGGLDGLVDDDLAYVAPWGFDPAAIARPTLILHGERDRVVPASHAMWLASAIPTAELWLRPDDGHLSVLEAADEALA